MVQVNCVANYRQSEANSVGRSISFSEWSKQVIRAAGRQARAAILHHCCTAGSSRDPDGRSLGCVLDGILNKIHHCLSNGNGVAHQIAWIVGKYLNVVATGKYVLDLASVDTYIIGQGEQPWSISPTPSSTTKTKPLPI